MPARAVTATLVVVLLAVAVLPVVATAQPTPTVTPQSMPPAPQPAPDLFAESMKTTAPVARFDAYDVGSVAINMARAPLKIGLCVVGLAAGAAVLGVSLGTAHRAAAAAVNEGCGGKWFISGDDLRPDRVHDTWPDRQSGG
ncbi:MAG: hypothetical protein HY216_09005 [Candidatus Rokubacteria bacterium]|nr:hypothetical protein [Candidatus Rokubacteria bacterium]